MRRIFLIGVLMSGGLLFYGNASAQLVLGQYEDEAPLGTWNIIGAPSAPASGLGGIALARAWDSSVSLTNPALLPALPRLSASLSGSYALSSLFRYSLVNTGVVSTNGNLTAGLWGIDHGGLAFRSGKWAFALAAAAPESYGRPRIVAASSGGSSSYRLTLDQSGYLRLFHIGMARRLAARLSVGLGVNYVTGNLARTIVEETSDAQGVVTITDDKQEDYRGLFLNGGVAWEATPRLTAALTFRSAYIKRAKGRSGLHYEAPAGEMDILIDAEATNEYRQPWIVAAGCSYRLAEAWGFVADMAYFSWSRYKVTYFEEPLERPFRDVVKTGAGVEYLASAQMYGKSARIPFRLGISFDPQPMREPLSSYLGLTFGTGLWLRTLAVDLSGFIGWESGSGDSLKARRVVLTIRYIFAE